MKLNLIYSLTLISQSIILFGQPAYVPQSGLKAYWPFSAATSANDLGPNSFVSTLHPSPATQPSLAADRFGTSQQSYAFNGTNWIETPYSGVLGDSARSVSFWAKSPGNDGKLMYLVGWGGNNKGDRFGCGFDFTATGDIFVGGANSIRTYTPIIAWTNNNWHHYVYQFSKSFGPKISNVRVWQDADEIIPTQVTGVNVNQVLYTSNIFNVTFGKIIYPVAPEFYNGLLDEVGIWQRTLTQCEISELYYADANIGTMTFNPGGHSGPISNLAQHTKTTTGNPQFPLSIVSSTFSGPGVTLNAGLYQFNAAGKMPPGTYTINHSYVLKGGCIKTVTATIKVGEEISGIDNASTDTDIELYPNPANGIFTVKFPQAMSGALINISDLTGRLIFSQTVNGDKFSFESRFERGIYTLELLTAEGIRARKRLVITK